jgi:hypothetical protein
LRLPQAAAQLHPRPIGGRHKAIITRRSSRAIIKIDGMNTARYLQNHISECLAGSATTSCGF